jgi:signal transduction histidine kinase
VHRLALERAYGRIFAVVVALFVLEFWSSTGALSGQRPGSIAANGLLSLLLIVQAIRALRRPPPQPDLNCMAVAATALLAISWLFAVPGSPFLNNAAYLLVVPVAVVWAALSRHFFVPVPILLVILATGAWYPGAPLAVEESVTTLATVAFAAIAARLMRGGARHADAAADLLSRRMAGQAAALAMKEAERRAANAVHDDVLSVLRAVSVNGQPVPWHVLVSKAKRAQAVLSRQVPGGGRGVGGLGAALQRQALQSSADLDVRCDISSDLDVPPDVTEALSAAAAEALRNVAAHAKVRSAKVTASDYGSGGVTVAVWDRVIGFDPAHVGPASTGLRNSICARLRDAGGHAEIISSPGQGTTVVLTWSPPPANAGAVDSLEWGRRLAPPPALVFLGFMLPQQLSYLALLCLRWPDLRWPSAAVAVFAGLFVLTAASARNVSRIQMTPRAAGSLMTAVTALVAVGTLAVTPGTTDAFAYWIAGESATLIGVIFFLRGLSAGLPALALDLAALTAGLLAAGDTMPAGGWVGILGSPILGAGAGMGFLAAFRRLSSNTEHQLADYRERLRRQALAAAMSRADSAALQHAREIAGPVLSQVASGQPPSPALRTAVELASATLRDELLAPGFLTTTLAGLVRAARASGAHITVNSARPENTALTKSARQLLAAALACADAVTDVTLHVHPPAQGHPAILILHVRTRPGSDHAALRQCARQCGAVLSDLDDHELLVRLQEGPRDS